MALHITKIKIKCIFNASYWTGEKVRWVIPLLHYRELKLECSKYCHHYGNYGFYVHSKQNPWEAIHTIFLFCRAALSWRMIMVLSPGGKTFALFLSRPRLLSLENNSMHSPLCIHRAPLVTWSSQWERFQLCVFFVPYDITATSHWFSLWGKQKHIKGSSEIRGLFPNMRSDRRSWREILPAYTAPTLDRSKTGGDMGVLEPSKTL